MRIATLMSAMALAVLAACMGGYGGNDMTGTNTPGPDAGVDSVTVYDNYFSPTSASIAAGSAVKWAWTGTNSHNVTFDDGVSSATLTKGTYSRTFATPGTYNYHCTIHGTTMSGTVTVK